MDRFVKVATPVAVVAVSVPPSVPVPEASDAVTVVPLVATRVPEDIGQPDRRLDRERHAALRRRRRLGRDLTSCVAAPATPVA